MHYFKFNSDNVHFYNITDKQKYKKSIDRKIPEFSRTIYLDNQKIFIIGGSFEGNKIQKLTWEYDIQDNAITVKADMNQQRSGFGIAYDDVNQIIYAMAGYDGKQWLSHCEKYSVEEDKWSVISPMRKKKAYLSACIVATSYIYVIGGYNGTRLNHIDKYTITTNKWEIVEPSGVEMPARSYPFSFAINMSQILIAGGYKNDILKDSYILDTQENTLTATSDLP